MEKRKMIKQAKVKSALLTKSELKWLLGKNSNVSKSYEYKMKSDIRNKLKILTNLELPIIKKCGIFSEDLTIFGKSLTVFGKVDNSINSSNLQIPSQIWWAGRDRSEIPDGS
jgi:hypothetical protein